GHVVLLLSIVEIVSGGENPLFGIRHDKSLADYEALAASSDASRPDFSTVVFFGYSLDGSDDAQYVASGTLITEEWILTAGHNFYDAQEQNDVAPTSGIQVTFGNDPNTSNQVYTVAEIVMHPTWLNGDQDYADANDLCLVRLSQAVTNITPAPLHTAGTEELGSLVYGAGFGDYSETEGQDRDLYSRKHALANHLDRIVGGLNTSVNGTTYPGGLLAFDFDDLDGFVNSLGDDDVTTDEVILGDGTSEAVAIEFEAGTVQGDSGGPLFVRNGTQWEVAGVLSGGADAPVPNWRDGDYGDISIYTRVSTAMDWINAVIGE
ncbi:MAG: trypsin-like serine protease, partial [Bacteroidota bacterium]